MKTHPRSGRPVGRKTKKKAKPDPALNIRRHVKACRCRGKSTGSYKLDGELVPVAWGVISGADLTLKCDRCGKRWRKARGKR